MSLTWHIVRKDLLRLRWVLLLWVVAIVAQLCLATIQSSLDEKGHVLFYAAAWTFGSIFVPVIGFGLVMGLQDDDPVAATDAFWITRPITGGRLLGAKALALALLCLVPVFVDAPFWVIHDFGPQLLGRAAVRTLTLQAFIAMLAVPFAIISANGSRFVMNVMLGGAILVALMLLYGLLGPGSPRPDSETARLSRALILVLIWTAAIVALAFNQYCRRRLRLSIAILAGAVAVGFAVSRWSNADFAHTPSYRDPANPQDPLVLGAGEGAAIVRDGFTMRIVSITPNDPHGVVIEVSESAPETAGVNARGPGDRTGADPNSERYRLTNRDDGRSMAAQVARSQEELHAGSLRYFRTTLVFDPFKELAGNVPANMATWVKGADLVKASGLGSKP